MKIYVASSWRNPWQPGVVQLLREEGHEVYDFRAPVAGDAGFSWREIDPLWQQWTPEQYRKNLRHPAAERGFRYDMDALEGCDACVLVQPCGTSAHLELGWAVGAGKRTAVLFPFGVPARPGTLGHSMSSSIACSPCGDIEGCWMPGKLKRVEPELMPKMTSGGILIGVLELQNWLLGLEMSASKPVAHDVASDG